MKLLKSDSFFDGEKYVKNPVEITIRDGLITELSYRHTKRAASWHARFVTPAFIDSHIHLAGYAKSAMTANLTGIRTVEELRKRLLEAPRVSGWILGRGWESAHLNFVPHKKILDFILPDTPCSLRSRCGHSLWVNTAALKKAAVTGRTVPPEGGVIEQDEDGSPTGILKENGIMLIERAAPSLSESSAFSNALKTALNHLTGYGIGALCVIAEPKDVALIRDAASCIPLRILVEERPSKLLSSEGVGSVDGVKLYKDGALGNSGALMRLPYLGTKNFGVEILDNATLEKELLKSFGRLKIFAVHAIGDLAVEMVVGLLSCYAKQACQEGTILRVEHFQTATLSAIRRAGRYGIIASVQPVQQYGDVEAARKRLGKRSRLMYRLRSMLDSGVSLAFGTDAPVESPHPWRNIQAAMDIGREGVYGDESITLSESLKCYTSSAASASAFKQLGRIKEGYSATLALYDEDPFEYLCSRNGIESLRPSTLLVDGAPLTG